MKKWTTTIRAIHNITGELCNFCGPYIDAPSWELADKYCQEYLGYCKVDGELIMEIGTKKDGITPDWNNVIDCEITQNN